MCFELKRGYNGTSLQDLLDSGKKEPEFIAFWKQCDRDRELGGRRFCFVVVKRDRKKIVLMISRELQNILSRKIGHRLYNKVDVDFENGRFTLLRLDDFLNNVPVDDFLDLLHTYHK